MNNKSSLPNQFKIEPLTRTAHRRMENLMINNHITYRTSCTSDRQILKKMWQDAFQDDNGFELFYKYLFQPDNTFIASLNGLPVSVAYQYHNKGYYIKEKQLIPCSCHYAFATDTAHRGQHIGMDLLQHILETQDSSGVSVSMIAPADEGLRDLYKHSFQYEDYFYVNELTVTPDGLSQVYTGDTKPGIYRILPDEYLMFREKLLAGKSHIVHTLEQIKYQQGICETSKGGLFHITLPAGEGIMVIEQDQDQTILCKELLMDNDDFLPVFHAILHKFSAKKAIIWLPDWSVPSCPYIKRSVALLRRNSCTTFVNAKAASVCQITNSQLPAHGYAGLLFG